VAAVAQLNTVSRKAILAAADSRRVQSLVRKHGMRLGAARFVAGETLDECIAVLRRLNDQGLYANTTLLGEGVLEPGATEGVVAAYEEVLDRIAAEELRANVALKLTHLGLEIDEELAYANMTRLLDKGQFIRIDMEQSQFVDATIRIYRRLRHDGFDNVGTVLQAYLYRTPDDLDSLLSLAPNLRLVKGAYLEAPDIAYPRKADVDAMYARLAERMLSGTGHVAVATHDESLIDHTIRYADEHGIPRDRFEFQMLYGVRPQLQLDLVRRGYKVLVATPFGPEWYPYLMRRLGERPANLLFFVKNTFRGSGPFSTASRSTVTAARAMSSSSRARCACSSASRRLASRPFSPPSGRCSRRRRRCRRSPTSRTGTRASTSRRIQAAGRCSSTRSRRGHST
jgi:proline dehydrogenase